MILLRSLSILLIISTIMIYTWFYTSFIFNLSLRNGLIIHFKILDTFHPSTLDWYGFWLEIIGDYTRHRENYWWLSLMFLLIRLIRQTLIKFSFEFLNSLFNHFHHFYLVYLNLVYQLILGKLVIVFWTHLNQGYQGSLGLLRNISIIGW